MIETFCREARVLIVDDQSSNICLLDSLLRARGFVHIEGLTDPRLAVQRVQEWRPDLILLDLNMPHLNGVEVLQQLKQVQRAEDFLPVLVLTGEIDARLKRRALEHGATDLLPKPFDAAEVMVRIRNLLKTRYLHLQVQNQNTALEQEVQVRTAKLQEALEELKKTQHQLLQQARLHAFSEMAGGVVHDFNNSLMAVVGYSELMLNSPDLVEDRASVLDFLQIINTSGRDAAHVVSRLRDFYRPREICDVFIPLNLNDQLERAVPITQPKWKDQALAEGRRITVELDLQKVPLVNANEAELRQVLTNLIFNAVDALPEGGTITLRSRPCAGGAVFEVSDTGTGMTEEVRSRCLEPFFSTKGEKGTGLGLSMVFGILKRHGASIDLRSAPEKGTTIAISLPSADAIEAAAEAPAAHERPLQILVVDDEPVTRDVVSRFLKQDGHEVTVVTDGPDALLAFSQRDFDLLLTDHGMPAMNGLQLAAAAKVMSNDTMPVILLTGFGHAGLKRDEILAEVDVIVSKPVPQATLRRAVCEARPPLTAAEGR